MTPRNRWLLGLALFALALAIGLATRRPAQALTCIGAHASVELESVTVGGQTASTEPYAGRHVALWGDPLVTGGVWLTVDSMAFQGSAYRETYRAQPDAGR